MRLPCAACALDWVEAGRTRPQWDTMGIAARIWIAGQDFKTFKTTVEGPQPSRSQAVRLRAPCAKSE